MSGARVGRKRRADLPSDIGKILRREYESGLPVDAIGLKLGINRNMVRKILMEAGVEFRRRSDYSYSKIGGRIESVKIPFLGHVEDAGDGLESIDAKLERMGG